MASRNCGGRAQRTFDAVVLDADYRSGVAAVRALGRSGLHVAAAARWPASRHALARLALPDPADGLEAFCDALVRWLAAHPSDAVLTSSDAGVEALRRGRDALERVTAVALAPEPALAVATSKQRTTELARSLGIPVPRALLARSPADTIDAAGELGFPCVLKPDRSWQVGEGARGRRVASRLLSDATSARREAEQLVAPGSRALVQEFVRGRNEWIMAFPYRGRVIARVAAAVSRTWPPLGGNDVLRTSVPPPPDIVRDGERLLAAMGYEGFAQVEFRRGPDGRAVLMEVNPRLTQSLELALLAGVDFARMQLEWARGNTPVPMGFPRAGVRLSWLGGELKLLAGAALGGCSPAPPLRATARAVLRDYLPPPRIDGFAPDDPGPMLRTIALTARDATKALRGGRRRG